MIYNALALTVEGLLAVTNTGFVYSEAKLREESKRDTRYGKCALSGPHVFHKVTALTALGKFPIRKTNLTVIKTKTKHFLFFFF